MTKCSCLAYSSVSSCTEKSLSGSGVSLQFCSAQKCSESVQRCVCLTALTAREIEAKEAPVFGRDILLVVICVDLYM